MQPEVKMTNEDWKEGDDVEVDMSYEALPTIPEVDFTRSSWSDGCESRRRIVEEALDNLAETAQNFEDRKKGSKPKTATKLSLTSLAKLTAKPLKAALQKITHWFLGSNSFIPGFEDGLLESKQATRKT